MKNPYATIENALLNLFERFNFESKPYSFYYEGGLKYVGDIYMRGNSNLFISKRQYFGSEGRVFLSKNEILVEFFRKKEILGKTIDEEIFEKFNEEKKKFEYESGDLSFVRALNKDRARNDELFLILFNDKKYWDMNREKGFWKMEGKGDITVVESWDDSTYPAKVWIKVIEPEVRYYRRAVLL